MKPVLCLGLSALLVLSTQALGEEKFVVHEWGVQVIGRADGEQVLSAPAELLAALPKFVGRNSRPLFFEAHGWDKPVIHLYGREGMEVSVKIETPTGVPLAYYPLAEVGKGEIWGLSRQKMMAGKFHFEAGLAWKGRLRAAAPDDLPKVSAGHWWNVARTIPSSYIETSRGQERFLFYEATAEQKPVISAKMLQDSLLLKNSFPEAVGPVVILINDGAGIRGMSRRKIPAGKPSEIAKGEFAAWSEERVFTVCKMQWRALGMTEAEAEGIVKVWGDDLLDRLGVLVISPMPEELYNAMFPITIEPKPDELVRAGLVFDTLPGQEARRHWLPAIDEHLRRAGAQLASEEYSKRVAAQFAFRSAGTLASGVLAELAKSDEPEVRRSARELQIGTVPADLGVEYLRPRSKAHANLLVEKFWPPKKEEKPALPRK